MTIEFREGSAADRDAILALRACAFPDEGLEKQDPRFWDWEFGKGRYFVADDAGRIVAHIGFVPQTYVVASESVPAMLAVDAMTDPDYRRQSLFSRVVAFARDALRDSVRLSSAFQIREAVLPAMTRGGWAPIVRAPVLVRPLSVKRFLRGGAGGPPAVAGTASPRRPAAGETAGQRPALPSLPDFFARAGAHGDRSEDFLRWRFFENPHWHYTIDADDGAYIVTRRTMLRGLDTVALVDFAWRAGCERQGRGLLRQVFARGRAEGVDVAAVLITLGHPALPTLVRSGFLPSPHRFRFLVNDFGRPLRRTKWALTWADTDHL